MIREFNKRWEQDYLFKTKESLLIVTYRRNTVLEKNTKKLCDSQTTSNIEETM